PLRLRQREELVGVLQQGVAQLIEAPRALLRGGCGPRPRVERSTRGRDRGVDVGQTGLWRLGDHRFRSRRDVVVSAASWLDPLAVDVERVCVDEWTRVSHVAPHRGQFDQHMVYTCRTEHVNLRRPTELIANQIAGY